MVQLSKPLLTEAARLDKRTAVQEDAHDNSPAPALVDYRNNGKKPKPTFSAAEMQRRQDAIRGWMARSNVDACVFTSYHNICYLSDFLYCYFGRKYGLVDHPEADDIGDGGD